MADRKTDKTDQIERIKIMEERLRRAEKAVGRLAAALDEYEAIREDIGELDRYYGSREWRRDLEDDEAGRIPKDLPRGVLSEDEIYNLMADERELLDLMRELSTDTDGIME